MSVKTLLRRLEYIFSNMCVVSGARVGAHNTIEPSPSLLCVCGLVNCQHTHADSQVPTPAGKRCCIGSMLVRCQALGLPVHGRNSPRALPAAMGAATIGARVPCELQASFLPGLPHLELWLEQPVG